MDRFLFSFFNMEVMATYWPKILEGMWVTAYLAVFVVITGLATGLVLAVIRNFRLRPVNFLIIVAVDLLRALPPLVIIILLYFAFPYVGISMSGFVATWLSLSLILAAFAEEIFWAGILSIAKGQWEAARSTGLTTFRTLIYVVLPQAIRLTVAPLTNRVIAITKGTALGSVVAVQEILYQASSAQSFSANASPLTLGALAYLIIFVPVVIAGRWIETRFAWRR